MFEGLDRVLFTQDWLTIILLIVLILISLLKINYNQRFTKLFSLLYSEKYYTDFIKTKPFLFNTFHLILFFIVSFNISLWVYYTFQAFFPAIFIPEIIFYLKILVVVFLYIFIRYFTGTFLANIFEITTMQKHFTFLKFSNLSLIMLLSYPLLVVINYSTLSFHKYWITLGLALLLVLLFFRYFVILKNERIKINNFFYIILYLCALEIAPFIVIYKMFVD